MRSPSTMWCVREALAFTGLPASAIQLARQLDEPLRSVRSALSELAYRGEVKYVGQGRYRALLGA
jgi:DNA-binding IclR family transcriptional regulator